jgi:hypothetical protein
MKRTAKTKGAPGKKKGNSLIEGDHAAIMPLGKKEKREFRGHPELLKRAAKTKTPRTYTAAMCIASLLYPKNFPKIVASGLDRKTTYSLKVAVDKQSKIGIQAYYAPGNQPKYAKHSKRLAPWIVKKWRQIKEESGIIVNTKAVNAATTKRGSLVFFEVLYIHLPLLEKRISSMRESTRKRQAIALLNLLKREAKGRDSILVHA